MKNKILIVLLPILTILVVAIYGYLNYIHTPAYKIKKNQDFIKPTTSELLTNLQELEQKMNNKKSFIASSLGVSIVDSNEIPQNINSGASIADIYNEYNNLKIELANRDKNNAIIKALNNIVHEFNKDRSKHNNVIVLIVKYIALNELKTLINMGSPYVDQMNLIISFNDKSLSDTIEQIKKIIIPSNNKITEEYLKLADIIDYQIYVAKNNPSFIGKMLFKTKKYIGVKKEGENYPDNNIRDLIKQANFKEIYNLLKTYKINDYPVKNFFNDLENKVLADDIIQQKNEYIIDSIVVLTNYNPL